jgi:hypothetical protein
MAYLTERMPQRIVSGFQFGPRWRTVKNNLANGYEQRDGKWLFPNWEGRGNMGGFSTADREKILDMSMASRGILHVFRVRIPMYCTAAAQPLVTVAGVTYLSRAHTFGGETAYKLVQAPVTATLSGAGSVNMDTGVVTGASPGDTWSGTFDLWMRFDSDWAAITAVTNGVWEKDVELVEVRRQP